MLARAVALLSVPLLLIALTPPTIAGEDPADGRCDPTSLLVCARAGSGGNVECVLEGLVGTCSWSRGYIWDAFSRAGLPGEASGHAVGTLEVCIAGACQQGGPEIIDESCSYLPAMECGGDGRTDGVVGPIQLGLGQCLLVTVTSTVTSNAWAIKKSLDLASAQFTETSEGAGQVCPVDDGRD